MILKTRVVSQHGSSIANTTDHPAWAGALREGRTLEGFEKELETGVVHVVEDPSTR